MEIWKPVVGYKNLYSISNEGRVRRERVTRKIMSTSTLGTNGYYSVVLCKNSFHRRYSIHRLVAEAFIGHRKKGLEINHKDAIKTNNSSDNLEYVTTKENKIHAVAHGCYKNVTGSNHHLSKFQEQDILDIRKLFSKINSIAEIARRYKASENAIRCIVKRYSWKHI